jgi:hypothetical protein
MQAIGWLLIAIIDVIAANKQHALGQRDADRSWEPSEKAGVRIESRGSHAA